MYLVVVAGGMWEWIVVLSVIIIILRNGVRSCNFFLL